MSAPRFFVEDLCEPGRDVGLDRDDAGHAHRVLRMRVGDAVIVVREGTEWDAVLTQISGSSGRALVGAARDEPGGELPTAVTVMQALTKGSKFDFVVEKAVELGARRIIPVRCERSYADASDLKVERWRRIAKAAAAQARRRHVPVIDLPVQWGQALADWRDAPAPIVAYESAPAHTLSAALAGVCGAPRLAIAIGPEGGLTGAEIEAARSAGCALVSLGPTILRTETAALALLAAVAAHCGWW
jgi:16S rRNA (uracil1498-N3)-methyltransferase